MSMPWVNRSDSPGFSRVFGSQDGVRTEGAWRAERVKRDDEAGRHCAETDGPGRRNPLVGALMQALKGLMAESAAPPAAAAGQASAGNGGAAGAAAGGSGTDAAAASAAATDGSFEVLSPSTAATSGGTSLSGDLKDAAYAFAKELFLALRSEGPRGDGRHREDHDHGHHDHHGHDRGGHGDYGSFGGLVHRLQSLAVTYGGAGGTPGTATPATATSTSTGLPTPAAGAATATDAPPADAATDPGTGTVDTVPVNATTSALKPGLSINIQLSLTVNVGAAATPPATSSATPPAAESPLLSAFRNLMSKLQSPGGEAAAGSPDAVNATDAAAATAADKLKGFLLNLASALQAGRSEDASARPGVGSLVDLQA
jgi:hypothetical protein